jgi:hypothetical protein
MNPLNCPFSKPDFDAVYYYLLDLPLYKLIMLTMNIMSQLSPVEAMNYNINKFCQRYDDRRGRIAFIKKLVDDSIIMPLQFPHDALRYPQMTKMLSTAHYTMHFPFGKDEEVPKEECLTDELEMVSGPVNVTNPRWEHKNEAKRESSPEMATFNDTIILMADVTGMPEGSGITFDIYDTSEDPPMCVDSAKGRIQSGVGKGEWVVTDKSGKGEDARLEFEGIARSKASLRCEIPVIDARTFSFSV